MKRSMTKLFTSALLISTLASARAQQPVNPPVAKPADPKSQAQRPLEFTKEIVRSISSKYLLYIPANYSKDPQKRWPLILFLHGSGESGDDVEKVKTHGPPKLIAGGKEFPFIIVSPQCPNARDGWSTEVLNALLDDVIAHYSVDQDRVYLTGLSMGGYGTWALASDAPQRFAAIAPICGGGNPRRMSRRLSKMPIWVFHGGKDPTVPIKEAQDMVDALKEQGSDVKFTVYPDAGHDSWTATYDNPDLYTWFLAHTRMELPAVK